MYRELSNKQYNITIGLILLWGFAVNAIMCTFFPHVFSAWNPTTVLIGYFIAAISGICMSKFSSNSIISFAGYNLVVLPIGVVLSISLQDYYQFYVCYSTRRTEKSFKTTTVYKSL